MKRVPQIIVQLIHIQGPLKGEIQEFSEPVVSIGRDPSSHVCFQKSLTMISRKHSEILREGNRFKLVDKSTNGTFVNGKRVTEAFLKDGDVLAFSEGGPKVSFLTKTIEGVPEVVSEEPARLVKEPEVQVSQEPPSSYSPPPPPPPQPITPPEPKKVEEISIKKVQVPLMIQYGPTLRSFKELPVTIGKNPNCDFVLNHAAISDHHAQVFFSQDKYWVKDLTEQGVVSVNGQRIQLHAPLQPHDTLELSPQGPKFDFLGEGRLAEAEDEEPNPESPVGTSCEKKEAPSQEAPSQQETDNKSPKGVPLLKKFLTR